MIRSRLTWLSPNERTPGVSITQLVADPAGLAADAVRQPQRDRRGRGVPTAAGHLVDLADGPVGARDQRVDQGGLADARSARRTRCDAPPARPGRAVRSASGGDHLDATPSGSYAATSSSGEARSALVRQSSGSMPGVEAGHQDPVDHPGPWRRVGQRGDDHQLVGVGHDRPLVRVVVVGRPAQHGLALLDLDDPGQGALVAGGVADDPDPVADDDAGPAELPGLGGA